MSCHTRERDHEYAVHSFTFSASALLGARAPRVYETFLRSLATPGDIAEFGVFNGETSRELTRYVEAMGIRKKVHLFDCFAGLPSIITPEERRLAETGLLAEGRFCSSREAVLAKMAPLSRYVIHEGFFAETLPPFDEPLCFVHADADLYQSTVEVIETLNRCLMPGGWAVFDDYANPSFPGVKLAVDRFLRREVYEVAEAPDSLQCFARKRHDSRL